MRRYASSPCIGSMRCPGNQIPPSLACCHTSGGNRPAVLIVMEDHISGSDLSEKRVAPKIPSGLVCLWSFKIYTDVRPICYLKPIPLVAKPFPPSMNSRHKQAITRQRVRRIALVCRCLLYLPLFCKFFEYQRVDLTARQTIPTQSYSVASS